MKTRSILGALAAGSTLFAGAAMAQNLGQDTRETGHEVANAGRATGHTIADAGRDTGHAVAHTARRVGHGVHRVVHHRHRHYVHHTS